MQMKHVGSFNDLQELLRSPPPPECVDDTNDKSDVEVEDCHVFICAHKKRDKRCGDCGPQLFNKSMKTFDRIKKVHIHKCSHIGGHKYAGNVILFRQKIADWFGYVTTDVLCDLVHTTPEKLPLSNIIELWRGRTGLSKELHIQYTDKEEVKKRLAERRKRFLFWAAVPYILVGTTLSIAYMYTVRTRTWKRFSQRFVERMVEILY